MKRNIILLTSVFFIASMMISGCSKKAPEPPRRRIDLVLEIFKSLEMKNHRDALSKIQRLRQIDQTSTFLPEFETLEQANLEIVEAGQFLKKGDRHTAELKLQNASNRVGHSQNLDAAAAAISVLSRLEILAAALEKPKNSSGLEKDAAEFIALSGKIPGTERLVAYAKARLNMVPVLKQREDRIAIYSLEADARALHDAKTFVAGAADAEIFLEKTRENLPLP